MTAEYIDRKALTDELNSLEFGEHGLMERMIADWVYIFIDSVPTADVVPAKHGHWEWFDEDTGNPATGYEREWGWRCSCCRTELPDNYDDPDRSPQMNYCSNCGAKMDKHNEPEN